MDRVLQKRRASALAPRRCQTKRISDFPGDLVGKILSRVPITDLRAVRRTCKRWNVLSKTQIVCKAEATDYEFVGFMVKDYKVCSVRFNLRGILNGEGEKPSIKEVGGNNDIDQVEIYRVFHCDGLLLCVPKDDAHIVLWNPYLGQTRWIEPRNDSHWLDRYALGYDQNRNHKILRFLDDDLGDNTHVFGCEIYDISSDSWRVLDITPHWDIDYFQRGVSLKGNTYFFAKEKIVLEEGVAVPEPKSFLLCFDFTSERFGQSLPLPFNHDVWDIGSLSSVRDEKLAALFQGLDLKHVEIWITTKIEPNAASWIPFLKIGTETFPLGDFDFKFHLDGASFFIDEEKKTAVVFDLDGNDGWNYPPSHQTAFIIGENEYMKMVHLGERQHRETFQLGEFNPLVSSSYVPSLVQIDETAT